MLLALDIGNTNVTVGVFKGETLQATWRLATEAHRMPDEYAVMLLNLMGREGLKLADINHAVLCSVVPPLTASFEELCQRYFRVTPLVVAAGIKTGVRIGYENPREVGPDRICDAVAGYRLYGGPLIIVDFGTATTFNAITSQGEYLGGAIAPGITMAADALFERTAMLRRIELTRPSKVIGRSTVAAMQAGLVFGYVALVEGLVALMQKELGGGARVIATGGHAPLIAKETPVIEAVEPDLTLIGLRMIHELNAKPRVPSKLVGEQQ